MRTRFLPYTARRVSVGIDGSIYLSGKKLSIDNGKVSLSWILGYIAYDVSLLHYVSWVGSKIADHLIPEMRMVSPFEYYFDTLECEDKKNHYHVPGYSGYVVNRDGDLYSLITRKYLSWSVVKDAGYRYCRVKTDGGDSKILFRHRALCLTFKHPHVSVNGLVVNHLDGIPGSDDLANIEWATYSENNQHAYDNELKLTSQVPVEAMDITTGVVSRYPSINACAKATGLSRGIISWRIKKGDFSVYSDRMLFKPADGKPFPTVDTGKINRLGQGCEFIARNVFTKDLIVFTGASNGEILTGINADTILLHARKRADLPISGFNFRYLEEAGTFKEHSPYSLKIFKDNPVYPGLGVIVTDITSGEERLHTSVRSATVEYGISKNHIHNLCKTGKIRDNKIFSLHDPRTQ